MVLIGCLTVVSFGRILTAICVLSKPVNATSSGIGQIAVGVVTAIAQDCLVDLVEAFDEVLRAFFSYAARIYDLHHVLDWNVGDSECAFRSHDFRLYVVAMRRGAGTNSVDDHIDKPTAAVACKTNGAFYRKFRILGITSEKTCSPCSIAAAIWTVCK